MTDTRQQPSASGPVTPHADDKLRTSLGLVSGIMLGRRLDKPHSDEIASICGAVLARSRGCRALDEHHATATACAGGVPHTTTNENKSMHIGTRRAHKGARRS